MPFGNPLDRTNATAMQPQQVPQPPAFRPWADAQIGQMSGGTANTWDDLDAAFDALPAEPGKDKRDQAAQLKRQLLDTYTSSVLPQYYPDPKALSAAKAYAESQMAPHILGSAFKPLIAQKESAANDKTADQQDTFTRLAEQRDDAAKSAKAAIHLDQLTRKNGQKYIQELGLADMDTSLADEIIKTEKAKRVAKSLEIEQQYAAMQLDHATAQAELDRLYRENQNLDGARMVVHDNNGFVESGAYALGGVAKGLLAIPELLGRTYSGTVSGLSGEGFGKGWQDEAAVGGWMGHLAEEVSDWQQEISKYDEKAVAQQYMMQAFDKGGMEAGMEVLAANPEIAWEMLATSGVDSIAGFFTGGTVAKGARVAGNIAVDGAKALPKLLQSAKSLTAMKDVMVGATKAANTSRGADAAFTAGAIAIPSISAGLTDARESGEWMRGQLDAMSEDQFLSLKEIQAEQAIWGGMDDARRAEYIRNKKDDLVGQMMAEQTAVISAGLAATGYLGTKFGLEKFLLGSKAATTGTVNAGKAAAVQGVAGGALEAGEEVFETGVQHLFVNSYLDRGVASPTPFDNFSGAAVSGFIVGGPMDAGGAYMGAKRTNDAEAKIAAQQKANDARRAAGQTINPKDVAAVQSAEAAKKAWVAKEVQSQIAAENAARAATDARPEAWTGGSFVDKDGKLITMDAQKFTDAELDDADVQQRIDAAFAEFTKDTDPYSPLAILTSQDGMGLTGKQKGDLEYTYNLATDPKEQDKVLQYRAKVDVLAMTNRIRLSEVGKDFYGIVRKAMMPNFTLGATTPPPARPYAKADPLSMGLPRLEASPTYYPLQDASAVDTTWADELPQFQPQITGGIIYGESPEFFVDVQEVLGLPSPPKPPVDTRGIDGLQNFPQDRFAARSNQQVGFPIVDAQWEPDPLADAVGMAIDHGATQQRQAYEDELITLLEETAEQRAQQEAQAAAAEQAKQPRPLPSDSRSALAAGAGVPLARATVTVASVVEGDAGVQVVANDDGSMSVILSGNADNEVRIHAMEINSVVDSVRNAAGNNDPLAVTQMALDAIMNRVRQLGVKTKGLVPAVRFAVATEAMKRVDGEALTGRNMAARKRKAASLLFLQRTIEEDRARVLDPKGKAALEYVTGVRDVLPPKHKEYADILNAARIKWHETDGLLRKTGLYNQLDTAGHKVGVGRPQPKTKTKSLAEAVRQDVVEKGSVAASDAADAIVDGGLPTVEQAAAIVDAVNTIASPDGLESLGAPSPTMVADRAIRDAIAAYESDPRTLRWKELKTREDRIIREGGLLPPRTDQEQSDSAWTKQERARIARMQVEEARRGMAGGLESQSDLLDDPELMYALAKLNQASELRAAQKREDEAYAEKMRGLILKYADARRSAEPGDPAAMRQLVNSIRGKNPDWVNGVAPFVDGDTQNLATLIDHTITNVFGRSTAIKFEYIDQNQAGKAGGHELDRTTGKAVVTVKVGTRGVEALPAQRQAYTVVHEQMHRATSAVYNWGAYLRDHWNDVVDTLTPNDLIAVRFFDDMTAIYNQTIDRLVSRGVPRDAVMKMRGMNDAHEFMAEVARPEFRAILNNVYLGNRQSMLHRIMRAIAQMLGVKPGTALDRTMTAIGNMWHEVEAQGEAAEFFGPLQQADRVARAAKYGLGSDEFDAYIAASLEDVPFNSAMWNVIKDPMDNC